MNNKNELAAALAHEIKNPISIIKANIDYIKLSVKPNFNKCFSVIDKELNRLSILISDYNTLLQPSSQNELIFLEDLIFDVTEEFSLLPNKNINFIFDINPDLNILGDYKKLFILFLNIYKNSVEAINKDGYIITKLYSLNNNIKIDIIDSGSGISENIINNIYTPFFTTKENGSGLGLMICKSIVELHKGNICFNNIENGLKTTITLPLYNQKIKD